MKRNPPVRITWISYAGNMSDNLFRRRFRMTKECFIRLCRKIAKGVGEEEFKSEAYLERNLIPIQKWHKL